VRAELYECGAPEALALERYPMERARGMAIEAPAVRP
jgi:sulfur-oxidizing protein SoxA